MKIVGHIPKKSQLGKNYDQNLEFYLWIPHFFLDALSPYPGNGVLDHRLVAIIWGLGILFLIIIFCFKSIIKLFLIAISFGNLYFQMLIM